MWVFFGTVVFLNEHAAGWGKSSFHQTSIEKQDFIVISFRGGTNHVCVSLQGRKLTDVSHGDRSDFIFYQYSKLNTTRWNKSTFSLSPLILLQTNPSHIRPVGLEQGLEHIKTVNGGLGQAQGEACLWADVSPRHVERWHGWMIPLQKDMLC